MENKSAEIEQNVESAMNSINAIQPAFPAPFFYSKVLAKTAGKITVWERVSAFFLRPTIAFSSVCFVIVINAFVLYSKTVNTVSPADQYELASSDENSEIIVPLYDLENVKP